MEWVLCDTREGGFSLSWLHAVDETYCSSERIRSTRNAFAKRFVLTHAKAPHPYGSVRKTGLGWGAF